MYCEKCGKEIPNGGKFCTACGGAAVEEKVNVSQSNASETKIPENNFSNGGREKKKRKKLWIVLAAVIAVLAALSITAFASPYVNNLLYKTFTPADKYFKHTVKKNVKVLSDGVADMVDILRNSSNSNSAQYSMKATVGDELWNLIPSDEESAKYYNWIKDAEIKGSTTVKDDKISTDAEVLVNDKKLSSVEVAMDLNDEQMYMSAPEIMEKSVRMPLDGSDDIKDMFDGIEAIQKAIPEGKTVSDLIVRYSESVAEEVTEVEKKNDTVKIDGIEQKCTCLEVTVTPKTAKNVLKTVLKQLKGDEEIKKILNDIGDSVGEKFPEDEFEDSISEAIDEINDTDFDFEDVGFYIWVDNNGRIIGFGADEKSIPEFDGEIFIGACKKGDTTASTIRMDMEDGDISFDFSGKSKEEGGKISGDYILEVQGMEILSFKVSDVDVKKQKEGLASGKATISLASGFSNVLEDLLGSYSMNSFVKQLSDIAIEYEVNQDTKEDVTCSFAVLKKNDLLAKISIQAKMTNESDIKIPSDYVDVDDVTDPRELGVTFDNLLNALKDAGAPQEITDALEFVSAQLNGIESDNEIDEDEYGFSDTDFDDEFDDEFEFDEFDLDTAI